MHRIFISDLHLDDVVSPVFKRFTECLAQERARVDEIYILGDLVEMWVGDDDTSDVATALVAALRDTSALCPLYVMHGNRDFLFGADFERASGATLIPDPWTTEDGLVLSHGDELCTDDVDYQTARQYLRSEAFREDLLEKPLEERLGIGRAMREQSKQTKANTPAQIMDVNPGAVDDLIASTGARYFVHGHTHRPGIHAHGNCARIVTGDWDRVGWLCRQTGDTLQLECFSLARHYGT